MTKVATNIPAGALFTFATGEYSDYSIAGVFRATAEINPDVEIGLYLQEHPEQAKDYHFRADKFLAWVFGRRLMEPVDCMEWHVSSYGKVDAGWGVSVMENEAVS
jgi:hypothetical protein